MGSASTHVPFPVLSPHPNQRILVCLFFNLMRILIRAPLYFKKKGKLFIILTADPGWPHPASSSSCSHLLSPKGPHFDSAPRAYRTCSPASEVLPVLSPLKGTCAHTVTHTHEHTCTETQTHKHKHAHRAASTLTHMHVHAYMCPQRHKNTERHMRVHTRTHLCMSFPCKLLLFQVTPDHFCNCVVYLSD